jgi:hypothetical protein
MRADPSTISPARLTLPQVDEMRVLELQAGVPHVYVPMTFRSLGVQKRTLS